MATGPVLHMASPTHYANLMMRHMVAKKLSSIVDGLRVSAIHMPYWNIDLPAISARDDDKVCRIVSEQHMPFEQIRYCCDTKLFSRFDWHGYGQRMENFPAKAICRDLFRADAAIGLSTSDDTLVCPVRGGEILHAIHPGYTTLPVDFYADVIERTRLTPLFMGQIEDNVYVRRLRARFPRAEFVPHMGAIEDFQTIRKARNIVLPVSTFAWLAAWFSEARTIVLPVFGMYNPNLFGSHDLLPLGESAYRFFRFPEQHAVPLAEIEDAHARIRGQWHEVAAAELAPASL